MGALESSSQESVVMSLTKTEKPFFKKVSLSERKQLLREIAKSHSVLFVKYWQQSKFFDFKADVNANDVVMECTLQENEVLLPSEKKVVVSFSWGDERYFFISGFENINKKYFFKINVDLFILQRRSNIRIEVPKNYPVDFHLNRAGDSSLDFHCRILNVSAGGLRLEIPSLSPELKIGDRLSGVLRMPQMDPLKLSVEVRFVQPKSVEQNTTQVVGAQLVQRDLEVESYLFEVMTNLKKENRSGA